MTDHGIGMGWYNAGKEARKMRRQTRDDFSPEQVLDCLRNRYGHDQTWEQLLEEACHLISRQRALLKSFRDEINSMVSRINSGK